MRQSHCCARDLARVVVVRVFGKGEPRGRLGDQQSSLLVLMAGAAGANSLEKRMFVVYTNTAN